MTPAEKDQYRASRERSEEADRTFPQRYEEMLLRVARERAAAEDDGLPNWTCRRGPCTNQRMSRWNHGTRMPDPKVCEEHLTEDEREALARADQDVAERMERLRREPDCWSWPVPSPRSHPSDEEARAALHEWQRDKGCAICGPSFNLVEDHDHLTGLVRGNLCRSCNTKEGWGNTTPPFMKYRERNPASMLGVKVRYWSPWTGYAEPEPDLSADEQAAQQARHRAAVDLLSFPLPHDDRSET